MANTTNKPNKANDDVVFEQLENLDVQGTIQQTEDFFKKNKTILIAAFAAVVIGIGSYLFINKSYLPNKERDAQSQMFVAERYFENDSLDLALNGTGNALGFLQIIDEYKWTKAANLSNYYAGVIYLKKGNFDEAIDYLKKFSADDALVSVMALGALGDAYAEKGELKEALNYYNKAAMKNANKLTSPYFLLKAGTIAEEMKNYEEALYAYKKIKDDFATSTEGANIEKYIARIESKK